MVFDSASIILGPPEIYTEPPASDLKTIESGVQNLNLGNTSNTPLIGFTENNSLTYVKTGNPCLDFFFQVVPDTPKTALVDKLSKAWAYDPLTTLKLICNLRGVRGTGKCDKEKFYNAAFWLYKNHPKTLSGNVEIFAKFGYYKDLVEILYRLLEGENVRDKARREWQTKKGCKGKGEERKRYFLQMKRERKILKKKKNKRPANVTDPYQWNYVGRPRKISRVLRIEENKVKVDAQKEQARALRKEKEQNKAKRAFDRYTKDPIFRLLHDSVAEMFAELLKQDMQFLIAGDVCKISLASKWCPSIDSSYDKATLICENIARRVFPRDYGPGYEGIDEANYVYRIRDRLRKEVLVPLHKVLELPEVYMSANQWETLPYNRVASVAMKTYKEHFLRHDGERFNGYLEDVKRGDATIAAGALLPHDIIASLKGGDGGKVAELQWARMVEGMSKKGTLNNCIAVCDVSGSMWGTPLEVCVALGLLISELSEEPWKGKVITFSENPQMHLIRGKTLPEKTQFVRRMEWGGNTDFQKVFDNILRVAVEGKLREDQMIKRIFVFSDMEFDEASGHHGYGYGHYNSYRESDNDSDMEDSDLESDDSNLDDQYFDGNIKRYWYKKKTAKSQMKMEEKARKLRAKKGWETDYEVIQRKFLAKGYRKVPEIVFWNLRHSCATPVHANQSGVALVSGFCKNMAKLFMDKGEIIGPVSVMQQAISGELYQKLVVYD